MVNFRKLTFEKLIFTLGCVLSGPNTTDENALSVEKEKSFYREFIALHHNDNNVMSVRLERVARRVDKRLFPKGVSGPPWPWRSQRLPERKTTEVYNECKGFSFTLMAEIRNGSNHVLAEKCGSNSTQNVEHWREKYPHLWRIVSEELSAEEQITDKPFIIPSPLRWYMRQFVAGVEVFTRGANVLDKAVLHREKEKFFFLEFYAVHEFGSKTPPVLDLLVDAAETVGKSLFPGALKINDSSTPWSWIEKRPGTRAGFYEEPKAKYGCLMALLYEIRQGLVHGAGPNFSTTAVMTHWSVAYPYLWEMLSKELIAATADGKQKVPPTIELYLCK